jgi:hypothetical protein
MDVTLALAMQVAEPESVRQATPAMREDTVPVAQ